MLGWQIPHREQQTSGFRVAIPKVNYLLGDRWAPPGFASMTDIFHWCWTPHKEICLMHYPQPQMLDISNSSLPSLWAPSVVLLSKCIGDTKHKFTSREERELSSLERSWQNVKRASGDCSQWAPLPFQGTVARAFGLNIVRGQVSISAFKWACSSKSLLKSLVWFNISGIVP